MKPTLQIRITGKPIHDTVRFITLGERQSADKSTQQVENLRPDTACGLQARKLADFLCTGGIIQDLIKCAQALMLDCRMRRERLIRPTESERIRYRQGYLMRRGHLPEGLNALMRCKCGEIFLNLCVCSRPRQSRNNDATLQMSAGC